MSEIPIALQELQIWFAKILTRTFRETGKFNLPLYPDSIIDEIRERISPGPELRAEERLGLYNQQYWWRLFVLLQESYPTLVRLFGFRDFNTLIAEPYLLRYPNSNWFLPRLGEHLVEWLQEEYREDDRELLIQAAEIDAAYERLFHVGTNSPLTAETVSEKLYLQPTVALFEMSADFFTFRSKLLEQDVAYWQNNDLPELDNAKRKYYALLYQTKEGLVQEELEQGQYQLLKAFQAGSFLADACERLDASCADSIGDWFKRWVECGFFALEDS